MSAKIAIIDSNILAILGLKQILHTVMPMMEVDAFGSFTELMAAHPQTYFHFFVDTPILLQHMAFFTEQRHKTIVLTSSLTLTAQLKNFHSVCINQPEAKFIKDLLTLEQHAHAHGRNLPQANASDPDLLSGREIEVLALVAYGKTNKEIADVLNISVTTVITHRKNIMDKLGVRTLSALTIYAVMHGYVDVNKI